MKTNSFIYSLNGYLLSTYSLTDTVLDSKNSLAKKKDIRKHVIN